MASVRRKRRRFFNRSSESTFLKGEGGAKVNHGCMDLHGKGKKILINLSLTMKSNSFLWNKLQRKMVVQEPREGRGILSSETVQGCERVL